MKKSSTGKLRIIGGQWRSRSLPIVDLPGLRPTTDRVRETVFNWLQADMGGARCLDCFAGSGALGFEAASRGASHVLMLELQAKAAQVLNANVKTLQADNVHISQQDALNYLRAPLTDQFDVVFLDPPFESDLLAEACLLLEQQAWLSTHASIYIEMPAIQDLPPLPESWSLVKEKRAGRVGFYLLKRNFEF